ncbi:hypothetical protein DFH09DRAFT_1305511 [Mycena vulgaris]|nr:hypothetical protein DFH09DRAFT_1305511 [Mycena vulgaris]
MSSDSSPKQIEEVEVHGNMVETTAPQAEPAKDRAPESDLKRESVKAAEDISAQNELDGMGPPKPPRGTPRGKITNTISGKPGGGGKPRPAPK